MVKDSSIRFTTFKKWKVELDPRDTWLKYESNDNNNTVTLVYCDVCRKSESTIREVRNFNSSFIDGVRGASLKKDNCIKHAKSDMHSRAINAMMNKPKSIQDFFVKTPIGRSMTSVSDDIKKRVGKLIDIAFVLAQEEIAFNKFPKLVELEKRHGVDLGDTYNTVLKCEEFTECIGEDIENELKNDLKNVTYYSICCDGSTDVSVTEKEIIFLTYVDTRSCEVQCKFLKIADLESGKASAILCTIKETLDCFGIGDTEKKLVGFLADGASVNLGQKKGVAAELKKTCPWLLAVHCLSHRLELSVKDYVRSTYLTDIFALLSDVHEFYSKSPSRLHKFRELAASLNEENVTSMPTSRVQGVRWISHKKRSLELLIKNYGVIVQQMEMYASERTQQSAKLTGLLRKLKTAKFIVWVLFFNEVLTHFSRLSLSLQGDEVDMMYALAILQRLYSTLEKMKNGNFLDPLSTLIKCETLDESQEVGQTYQGISLANCSSIDAFKNSYTDVLTHLHDVVFSRFADLHQSGVVNAAMKILQDKVYPSDQNKLPSFGVQEIQYLCAHYKVLLEQNGIPQEGIHDDWADFKTFWHTNLRHLSGNELWKCVCKNYSGNFPNLCHIVNILRVFPVSNAKVERAFSMMKRVKTDSRNRMKTTLNTLLRISLEGKDLNSFSPVPATEIFFSKTSRRPQTLPYGQCPLKKQKTTYANAQASD